MAPHIITINSFRTVLNLDELIDHLIANKILYPSEYKYLWSKDPEDRLNYVIDFINKAGSNVENNLLKYLNEKHPNIEQIEQDKHDYHEALVRGGFPKLAKNSVKRSSDTETLTNKLKNLMPRDKLVVYGMMGCGKSFLVNQILNDVGIVKNYFDFKLFWVNLGEHQKNLDNILSTMWRLYSCVISAVKEPPLSHCPEDLEFLKKHVKELFLRFEMQNSLLILDDAGNDQLISHFDFGCKTVITTKNKNIVPIGMGTFVEVKAAFTEKETLEMFYCLGNTEEIEDHARDIYHICKGHPLVVAAISSFLNESKEDAGNPKIWEHIKENLSTGQYQFDETLQNAIKICVDNLKDDLKPYFYDLSIFQQDVNIPPEVLEILWQKNMIEVRNIMMQLANRSLVISFYHKDHKSYVYGVHDVFLNYLKAVTRDKRRDLHRKLIEAYNRVTNNNYLDLPNDNYTLQYIGFHLKEADDTEKFRIFLNLQFIEAKIRAAGHADVLRDMENYALYINKGNIDDKKLNDYRHFIKRFGPDIFYNDKTDIIQFALQEKSASHVYNDALAIATSNPSYPYFKLKNPRDVKRSSYKFKTDQDITAACFSNANEIFIGTSNGNIEKYINERKVSTLNGHTKTIISLKLNSNKTQLLSISEDHTVRVWKLKSNTRKSWDLSAHGSKADPKDKQRDWKSIIINESNDDPKVFKLNDIEDYCVAAAFSPNSLNEIAIGTNKGVITIWNTEKMQQICSTAQRRGYPVANLLFVKLKDCNPHIVCIINTSIFIFGYKDASLDYVMQLHTTDVPRAVFVCTPNDSPEIIGLIGGQIFVWNFFGPFKKSVYNLDEDSVCAILTNDSQYLIISTLGNSLCIWDNRQHKSIDVLYYWGLTKSLDTFYDDENSAHVLLISSDRKTLQQCEIKLQEEIRINSKFPEFSCWWNKARPLTAVRGKNKKIEIYQDYKMIAQTPEIKNNITYTKFCDTDHVVYGLESGEVRLFQLKNKNDRLLTAVEGRISYIELFGCVKNKKSYLIVSKDDLGSTCTIWPQKITQSFSKPKLFFKQDNLMFVVEGNGNISSWNLTENEVDVWYKNTEVLDVITATICSSKKHLALTFLREGNYFLQLYKVSYNDINVFKTISVDGQPNFSCYSFDGVILAIGMKSGDIQVWNTVNKYKSITLKLHETPVEYLLFSPGLEPILVSLGDQIAWWNLKKFQRTGRSFKTQSSVDEDLQERSTMNSLYWSSKQRFKNDQYLIACVKSHEQYAKLISASPEFTSFLTVDGTGKIYIMEVV
ncbi:unnamed protein product [Brassicogethes aeneus]|uniref:CARD domain-containing protein n=1 Tax=Brassicogethes aeneus TaxID=1431903 RepID=A0A9P0B1V0_BRAAE|nr:unnamed protein product [Brassicogethes aeneus]